jgi:hypothetical protein
MHNQIGRYGLLSTSPRACTRRPLAVCFGLTDPKFARDPATLHAACAISGLGTTQEHFPGITSAQRTSSAERTMIQDGNGSTRLSDPRARNLSDPFTTKSYVFISSLLPPRKYARPCSN